jgi:hypothetical protein
MIVGMHKTVSTIGEEVLNFATKPLYVLCNEIRVLRIRKVVGYKIYNFLLHIHIQGIPQSIAKKVERHHQ